MFYTYIDKEQWKPKISIYDVFNNNTTTSQYSIGFTETKTIKTNKFLPYDTYTKYYENKIDKIIELSNKLKNLTPKYDLFSIPKKTGGLRHIAAPQPETSLYLNEIKHLLENDLHLLSHNAAFAYVKGRCTKDALLKHVEHGSNFYLKIDLKDFFPSCNADFIFKQLMQLQIMASISRIYGEVIEECYKDIINYCLLDGGLPQGSPVSPLLTNLIMVPLDFYITKHCKEKGLCYTRYADDILISGKENFNFNDEVNYLRGLFENHAPFKINEKKTRYGSNKGKNWNLGLMINQKNEITIGYRKKERLRATIFNFFNALTTGNSWDIVDVQALQGTLSYYHKINPQMVENTIKKYEQKFNMDFNLEVQKIINP